jgi:hypothetical protein
MNIQDDSHAFKTVDKMGEKGFFTISRRAIKGDQW